MLIPADDPTSNFRAVDRPIPTFLSSSKFQTFALQLALQESAFNLSIYVTVSSEQRLALMGCNAESKQIYHAFPLERYQSGVLLHTSFGGC